MAAAVAALALVVAYHGERPEEAEAAWQLSSTAAGLLWPGREAAVAFRCLRTLRAATGWWPLGHSRASFDAWCEGDGPAPRGALVDNQTAWYEAVFPNSNTCSGVFSLG